MDNLFIVKVDILEKFAYILSKASDPGTFFLSFKIKPFGYLT